MEAQEATKALTSASASALDDRAHLDQVALVTGCSGAIGRATALAFAALNYRLVLVDANELALNQVKSMCQTRSPRSYQPLELALDLSEGHQVARSVVERTLAHFGRLDVLVNQAGLSASTKHDDPNCIELYHRIVATNQHAALYLSLASFGALKETKGSIVNVCSLLGDNQLHQQRHRFAYCMSKAAVAMMSKCLAGDFAPHVRVNCVSPGSIAGTILDDMGSAPTSGASIVITASGTDPSHKEEAEEVARMIVFLSSKDKAAGITGTRVLLDGSLSHRRPSLGG